MLGVAAATAGSDAAAARVMGVEHSKHPAQVPFAEDQHLIGDLGDSRYEAFGETVRPRKTCTSARNAPGWWIITAYADALDQTGSG
jgi:hypothetical protein